MVFWTFRWANFFWPCLGKWEVKAEVLEVVRITCHMVHIEIHLCVYIYILYIIYIPGTPMTLVLVWKGLVLWGWPSKIEVKQVLGIYIYTCYIPIGLLHHLLNCWIKFLLQTQRCVFLVLFLVFPKLVHSPGIPNKTEVASAWRWPRLEDGISNGCGMHGR